MSPLRTRLHKPTLHLHESHAVVFARGTIRAEFQQGITSPAVNSVFTARRIISASKGKAPNADVYIPAIGRPQQQHPPRQREGMAIVNPGLKSLQQNRYVWLLLSPSSQEGHIRVKRRARFALTAVRPARR